MFVDYYIVLKLKIYMQRKERELERIINARGRKQEFKESEPNILYKYIQRTRRLIKLLIAEEKNWIWRWRPYNVRNQEQKIWPD